MSKKGKHETQALKKDQRHLKHLKLSYLLAFVASLGLLIMLSSIYGFSDQRQHKTNEFRVSEMDRDIFLIGQDEGITITDWQMNQALKREIRVKNGVEQPVPTDSEFDPLYVRLNLQEFLEFAKQTKHYSDSYYLQDKQHEMLYFRTQVAATEYVTNHNLPASVLPERVKTESDLEKEGSNFSGFWYLKVTGQTPEGWQSDRLVLFTELTNQRSLIPGVANARADAGTKHQHITHGEDLYTTRLFDANLNGLGDSQRFDDYISLGFSSDVISLSDWVTRYGSKPVKKWIVDTGNTNGWVYWGEILLDKETTSNFLETVTLHNKPLDQSIYYAIHANMEAVDASELAESNTWIDMPQSLRLAWQNED